MTPKTDKIRRTEALWGERGLPLVAAPRSPVPAMLTDWCGVEAASYLSVDATALFEEALAVQESLYAPVFEALADAAPVVVHFCDNVTAETAVPFWDRYMARVYRKRIDCLHAAGTVCVIHNDGAVRGVLPKIAEVGFDGAEALTPAPVGDVEVSELRALTGREDFILWGLVPGAMFSAIWPEEGFRAHVQRVLDTAAGPCVLGTADQVPPDADIERVRLVSEMLASC